MSVLTQAEQSMLDLITDPVDYFREELKLYKKYMNRVSQGENK